MPIKIAEEYMKPLECFIYHKDIPKGSMELMEVYRQIYVDLAVSIKVDLPEGRSKSLALTHLEESLTRCIQALALKGVPDVE